MTILQWYFNVLTRTNGTENWHQEPSPLVKEKKDLSNLFKYMRYKHLGENALELIKFKGSC